MTWLALPRGNPMQKVLLSVLVFEVVVFGLMIPGLIQVSAIPAGTAALAGGAGMALAGVAAGLLGRPVGYLLGWLTQILAIGFGVLTEMMFWLGGVFAVVWVTTFVLGRRLADRATPDR